MHLEASVAGVLHPEQLELPGRGSLPEVSILRGCWKTTSSLLTSVAASKVARLPSTFSLLLALSSVRGR